MLVNGWLCCDVKWLLMFADIIIKFWIYCFCVFGVVSLTMAVSWFGTTESKEGGVGGYLWAWPVSQHFCWPWEPCWWWTPLTVSSNVAAWKKEKLCSKRFVALTTLNLSFWSWLRQVVWLKRSNTLSGIFSNAGTGHRLSFPLPSR